GAVLDQAFDAAEGCRPLPDRDTRRRGDGGGFAAGNADAEHAAEAALHLARGNGVARAVAEAGIKHRRNARMAVEMRGETVRRGAAPRDADEQRAHAAQQEPRFERTENAALRCPQCRDALPDGIAPRRDESAGDDIA